MALTDKEKAVVWAICRHDLSPSAAAGELFYCRNSIDYQARRIRQKTGLDPKNFYDAIRLLEMIGEDPQREENEATDNEIKEE